MGIDRLLDFIFGILYLLKFWIILNEYEQAVVLTLGKKRRKHPVLGPGIHFVIPFGIEEPLVDNVVPSDLPDLEIEITLKCGTPLYVVFSALWRITDMEKYQLEIESADAVLTNVQGMVQEFLFQYSWDELMEMRRYAVEKSGRVSLPDRLRTHCNRQITKWGAELTEFYIQSFIRPDLRAGVIKVL